MFSGEIDNRLTHAVIGAAIEVHQATGPGLLESAYRLLLCRELALRNIRFSCEVWLDVDYKGIHVPNAYRLDFLIDEWLVVEIKAVETLLPVHKAQLLTYLRLGNYRAGLLMNFHNPVLTQGISRILNSQHTPSSPLR